MRREKGKKGVTNLFHAAADSVYGMEPAPAVLAFSFPLQVLPVVFGMQFRVGIDG